VRWMGKIAGGPGVEKGTCNGSAEVEIGNIVPGVFSPVLAKHSNPNRRHWQYCPAETYEISS
jgi:hypothetical protein